MAFLVKLGHVICRQTLDMNFFLIQGPFKFSTYFYKTRCSTLSMAPNDYILHTTQFTTNRGNEGEGRLI